MLNIILFQQSYIVFQTRYDTLLSQDVLRRPVFDSGFSLNNNTQKI